MLRQLITDLKLNKQEFLVTFLMELGGFLFGVILVNIIMRVDDDPGSWFCMGTLLALVMGLVMLFFLGGFGYSGEFQLALSMGRTRGAFMGSYALRLVLRAIAAYAAVLVFYRVELAIYPVLFPAYENEVAFTFLTDWRLILPGIVGLVVLTMFLGAMFGRFGKKGMWVFYVLWLFCCFVLPRMTHEEPGSSVLDQAAFGMRTLFFAVPLTTWAALAAILAVGMTVAVVVLGKKQMVKL